MSQAKQAVVARLDRAGREKVRAYLESRGYRVVEADNGMEALRLLKEGAADMLLADGVLPKLSGFDLCREAKTRAEHKPLSVVLVVDEGDSYGRGRARAEGADLVLTEPVLDDDLADALRLEPGRRGDDLPAGGSGRDRFVKELLRGGAPKNEPFVARISDPLTGLHNKAFIGHALEEEFKKARRYGHPLSLLVVDVDNYDETLKQHGKAVANEMLLEVAGVFLCESRDVDCSGRIGESRFLLVLPNTDLAGGRTMADRVFQQVCSRRVHAPHGEVPIRVCVGITALPSDEVASVDDFLERAQRALNTARSLGTNRICALSDGPVDDE